MPEIEVGAVTHYFDRPHAAIVKVTAGEILVGDTLHIKGHSSDFTLRVTSIEVEHQKRERAGPGDEVGIQVAERARAGDKVYKVT